MSLEKTLVLKYCKQITRVASKTSQMLHTMLHTITMRINYYLQQWFI